MCRMFGVEYVERPSTPNRFGFVVVMANTAQKHASILDSKQGKRFRAINAVKRYTGLKKRFEVRKVKNIFVGNRARHDGGTSSL